MRFILILLILYSNLSFANKCQDAIDRTHNWRLTRDRMPDIFAEEGSLVEIQKSSGAFYQRMLLKKLSEEVGEFNRTPNLEELADIKEVVLAINKSFELNVEDGEDLTLFVENIVRDNGFDDAEVEKARLLKRAKKGGFDEGYLMRAIPARRTAPREQETRMDSDEKTKGPKT